MLSHRFRQLLVPLMIVPLLLVASCGGNDDESAPESTSAAQHDTTVPDASDVDADTDDSDELDEQVVCNLLSNEEVSEITGFDVIAAEGNTMGLPVCDWELSVPESADVVGLPMFSIVLLSESEYRTRVDPLSDSLSDIDGPADENKLHYAEISETGTQVSIMFFALKDGQGIHITLGFGMWEDEAATKAGLLGLANKVFDRI